ncbi:hypothetical protein [Flavobacterium adhaerens]|uniref:hypothetical protein n=1 Tax=Flavobacterium adhaerens TaxID=3149043 RepID=UPI0032B5F365
MTNQSKISFTWLAIALSLVMHTIMEISSHIFFPKPDAMVAKPGAEIPPIFHVIYISAMILPMIVGFITLITEKKIFKVITFVYAILLVILNAFHFVEQISGNPSDISQVVLLLFVVVANVYLIIWLNKWQKIDI